MKTNLNRRAALTTGMLALLGLGYGGGFVLAESAAPRPKVVRLTARRFAYSPAHLTLKKGVPVVLELKSLDVLMGFNLPDFGLRADMLPNQAARVPFVPDKTGKFVFLCDIFCGTGHEQMQGTLTVVD
ncbi:MAG TPA: cupredoxin domain-containing protein [Burkholderiales bacterium]|jgi:cytochrome c oxidase subunit 2|nr:cupredoxin domain-containing protein [Burkholderiales bacterium]